MLGPQRCITSPPPEPDSCGAQHSLGFSWLHAHLPQASQGHPRNLLIKHCQMPSSTRRGAVEALGPSAPGQGSRLSLHSLNSILAAYLCMFISLEEAERPSQHRHALSLALQVNPLHPLDCLAPFGFFPTRAPQAVHRLSVSGSWALSAGVWL